MQRAKNECTSGQILKYTWKEEDYAWHYRNMSVACNRTTNTDMFESWNEQTQLAKLCIENICQITINIFVIINIYLLIDSQLLYLSPLLSCPDQEAAPLSPHGKQNLLLYFYCVHFHQHSWNPCPEHPDHVKMQFFPLTSGTSLTHAHRLLSSAAGAAQTPL
jgi:hypothetical protein